MESYSDLEHDSSVELSETELEETPDLFLQPAPAAVSAPMHAVGSIFFTHFFATLFAHLRE